MKFSTTTIFALLLTVVLCGQIEAARLRASNNPPGTLNFLNSMCAKTTYTRLCVSSLSPYNITISNSTVNLAQAAVSVSLDAARSASSLVTRLSSNGVLTPSETFSVRDCVPTMGDCVMVLQKSLDTMVMVSLNESKLAGNWMEMDNIKTWVSAAMTDENTCLSGFTGGETTTAAKRLKRKVMDAMQRTSNALALLALIGPGST